MMGGSATADAVARARRLPSLGVGLHVVVVRGRAVLPHAAIPDLAGPGGDLKIGLVKAGFSFFFLPAVRRQLEAEIRAQFEAFRETGLRLDHVNAHNHMHLHPTVLGIILALGRGYGAKAVRLPYEPFLASWRASREGFLRRLGFSLFLLPWISAMKWRIRRAGMRCNDYMFGMHDSGRLTEDRVLCFLSNLPQGITEMHFHPATRRPADANPAYAYEKEFEALMSPRVAKAVREAGIRTIGFADLGPGNG